MSYKKLLTDFEKFEKVMDEHDSVNDYIDLSSINFLNPTNLLPLLNYGDENEISKYIVHNNVENYTKKVLGIIDHSHNTIPYITFSNDKKEIDEITSGFYSLLDSAYGGVNTLNFMIYEIINNMFDHSDFSIGRALAQLFPKNNYTDISFMDNGVSIPGRFEKCGFEFENDCDAIFQAINGKSSDLEKENRRGTGLNSTINLVTNGNKGSILIASRNGLCYIDENTKKYKQLNNNYIYGTLVSLRIKKVNVDYSKYMGKIEL
ncbi:ATP-binding protein [Methanobrevibacter filiformis]|uniref:Uncharacterized protein n=1 Tax=Methanobrevibacter filiformis TaxID=55758 RepID=A0A166F450_9EURY|nr:ATP-binding protein [Methanobrevibacter filiformis]KZX17293.1 hypothetical protein MBFIL_02540 [Methanobrevibacter filiformis]